VQRVRQAFRRLRAARLPAAAGTAPERGHRPSREAYAADLWMRSWSSASKGHPRAPDLRVPRLWALLRYGEGPVVNPKDAYRIPMAKRWFGHQRSVTPRPRVQGRRSIAPVSDSPRAIDSHTSTAALTAGPPWPRSSTAATARSSAGSSPLRGRTREAERALEEACLQRFGTLRADRPTPVISNGNGLIFTARRFGAACSDYRLRREFITPYTPEQNGMTRARLPVAEGGASRAEQLRWLRRARAAIASRIHWYNERRPMRRSAT